MRRHGSAGSSIQRPLCRQRIDRGGTRAGQHRIAAHGAGGQGDITTRRHRQILLAIEGADGRVAAAGQHGVATSIQGGRIQRGRCIDRQRLADVGRAQHHIGLTINAGLAGDIGLGNGQRALCIGGEITTSRQLLHVQCAAGGQAGAAARCQGMRRHGSAGSSIQRPLCRQRIDRGGTRAGQHHIAAHRAGGQRDITARRHRQVLLAIEGADSRPAAAGQHCIATGIQGGRIQRGRCIDRQRLPDVGRAQHHIGLTIDAGLAGDIGLGNGQRVLCIGGEITAHRQLLHVQRIARSQRHTATGLQPVGIQCRPCLQLHGHAGHGIVDIHGTSRIGDDITTCLDVTTMQ